MNMLNLLCDYKGILEGKDKFEIYLERVLTSDDRNKLKTKEFGIPELRKYPIYDEKHVRSAISYFKHSPSKYRKELAGRIKTAADKFDVKISKDSLIHKYLEGVNVSNQFVTDILESDNYLRTLPNEYNAIKHRHLSESEEELNIEDFLDDSEEEDDRFLMTGDQNFAYDPNKVSRGNEDDYLDELSYLLDGDPDTSDVEGDFDIIMDHEDDYDDEVLIIDEEVIPTGDPKMNIPGNKDGGKNVNFKKSNTPDIKELGKMEKGEEKIGRGSCKSEMVNHISGKNINIADHQDNNAQNFQVQNRNTYSKIDYVKSHNSYDDTKEDDDNFFVDKVEDGEIHSGFDVHVDYKTGINPIIRDHKDFDSEHNEPRGITKEVSTDADHTVVKSNDNSNHLQCNSVEFSELDCRVFRKNDLFVILESDLRCVQNFYQGTKTGSEIIEMICEYHRINPDNLVVSLVEGKMVRMKK